MNEGGGGGGGPWSPATGSDGGDAATETEADEALEAAPPAAGVSPADRGGRLRGSYAPDRSRRACCWWRPE